MTQTRKEALTDLLAKVEAGTLDYIDSAMIVPAFPDVWNGSTLTIATVVEPDLNGMEALHKAVLPGWVYCLGSHDLDKGPPSPFAAVSPMVSTQPFEASGTSPARAWRIAILKALIAQEPDQ